MHSPAQTVTFTFPATRYTHRTTLTFGRWYVALIATDTDYRVSAMLLGRNAVTPWALRSPLLWSYRSLFFGQA